MRILLAAAVAVVALAGCSDDSTPTTDPVTDGPIQMVRDLPANITASEMVVASLDPLPATGAAICEAPSAQCFEYEFTINASRLPDGVTAVEGANLTEAPGVHVQADLSWGVAANDFDLFLFLGDQQIVADQASPPATTASVESTLAEGTYRVVVLAFSVGQDTFDLAVTFT